MFVHGASDRVFGIDESIQVTLATQSLDEAF